MPPSNSPALFTDRYELTMLDAALADGTAERPCVFETFTRRLPAGRRYGVVAGLGRLLPAIASFRFDDAVLAALDDHGVVSPATLAWLAGYRFRGRLHGYREGEVFVPNSPVLTVEGTFADAVVLETLILSVLNHDSAVAGAGARMVTAAQGRGLFEFGSRRAHEEAAVAAARAAYLVGFDGTSNLAAGARFGVPTLGTSAHAFTLLHDDERTAFESQVSAMGPGTTLLVDTYDVPTAITTALQVAGKGLGAVRIDSGDLGAQAHAARRQLDAAGATGTRIVVSGDLDEDRIAALAPAPIDAYGVGTRLVTGSGHPTAGFVYKLVARARRPDGPLEAVAKGGGDKATVGTHKRAGRRLAGGRADAEVLQAWDATVPADHRALQVTAMADGEVLHEPSLEEIRSHHRSALAELHPGALALADGEPCLPTVHDHPILEESHR
ncbi:MAG: nicotinate phosphoribosyltransferase [Nitriliruptoraceae bacterium]|nr:nicotinate phosphoribosyltransferase [Nitriliruptoraceae bacterium]